MPTADLPRDDMAKMIRELEKRIAIIEQRSPFANTGLSAPAVGTTQVDGNLNVVGTSIVSGAIQSANYVAGTSGWRGDGSGFEFNPATGSVARVSASNFALPYVGYSVLASASVVVPDGFTKCQVSIFGRMYAINPNSTGGSNGTGGDALYVKAGFNGTWTTATPTGVSGSGGFASTYGGDAFIFTGLTPGSSLTIAVEGSCGFQDIAASVNNYASASASILWSH